MLKKILLLVVILFGTNQLFSQDGINYQGAATDADGEELVNQTISIRVSIISNESDGNLEWEETHSVTTDQFGLFNIVLGQGESTSNGSSITFDNIDWGSGDHFLKVEIDTSGGSDYSMVGTTQMMSVPYALYAKNADIDPEMLTNMLSSIGGGSGGGCSLHYPEGVEGEAINGQVSSDNPYIVPDGKKLYVLSWYSDNPAIDGYITNTPQGIPIILNPGESLTSSALNLTSFSGLLIDSNQGVEAITQQLQFDDTYQVPNGKRLYMTNSNGSYYIDGIPFSQPYSDPTIVNSGQVLTGASYCVFNGYLVDEDYFSNCGGNGNSGSMENYSGSSGSACDFNYPTGLNGQPLTGNVSDTQTYSVPQDSILYLRGWYNGNAQINGFDLQLGDGRPLILDSGDELGSQYAAGPFHGYLVEKNPSITIVTGECNLTENFVVPDGKRFYLMSFYSGSPHINDIPIWFPLASEPLILNSGDVLSTTDYASYYNGYLVDEDYFSNCVVNGNGSIGNVEESVDIDSNIVPSLGLEMDTIYYNLDASQTGWGYHYLDTLTIEDDGYIFTRRTTSSIVGANQAVFYLNYGYDLEEQMYLVGYENQTEIIPIKADMKIAVQGNFNTDSNLDVFFIKANSGNSSSAASMNTEMMMNSGFSSWDDWEYIYDGYEISSPPYFQEFHEISQDGFLYVWTEASFNLFVGPDINPGAGVEGAGEAMANGNWYDIDAGEPYIIPVKSGWDMEVNGWPATGKVQCVLMPFSSESSSSSDNTNSGSSNNMEINAIILTEDQYTFSITPQGVMDYWIELTITDEDVLNSYINYATRQMAIFLDGDYITGNTGGYPDDLGDVSFVTLNDDVTYNYTFNIMTSLGMIIVDIPFVAP